MIKQEQDAQLVAKNLLKGPNVVFISFTVFSDQSNHKALVLSQLLTSDLTAKRAYAKYQYKLSYWGGGGFEIEPFHTFLLLPFPYFELFLC